GGPGDRPLLAADDRPQHGAADGGPADLLRAAVGRRVTLAVDRLGTERHLAAVGEHQRVEPDAQAGTLLHLAAAFDGGYRAGDAGPCRYREPSAREDVTRDTGLDAVFEAGLL